MKIAIVGSRSIFISASDIEKYISQIDEIVSGGARGVDTAAAEFAKLKGLKLTEFLPEYSLYGRAAPIIRNRQIVDYADKIIIFWNGASKGTLSVINYAQKTKKPCEIIIREDDVFK